MKINGFRIGNYVTLDVTEFQEIAMYYDEIDFSEFLNDNNRYATVVGLRDEVELVAYGCNIDFFDITEIKPIPLTEEWLVKFGFVFTNKTEYFVKNGFYCFKGMTELTHDRFILAINSNKTIFIDYVHQLQNLYFALTEEELKIKQS